MRYHPWAAVAALLLAGSGLAGEAPGPSPGSAAGGVSLLLLGTQGGPEAIPGRAGIASLVTVSGRHYLVDAGEGLVQQLARAEVPATAVRTVLLTHLHDDHTVGLGALASFKYTFGEPKLELIGPPGTSRLAAGLLAFATLNAEIRGAERQRPPLKSAILGKEVRPGIVLDDGVVKVTAAENTHYSFAPNSPASSNKSYSYRFEAPGRVIVFTGDTGPSAAVEKLAKGADILVAEMVTAVDIARVPPNVVEHMLHEHLNPTEVGKLANAAGAKKLVISHYRTATDADVAEIRRHYAGEIVLGMELDRF